MQKVHSSVNIEGRKTLGIRPGDTVRVVQNIVELKKGRGTDKKEKTIKNTRKQTFEGLVLAVKHGREAGASFTVRATLSGVYLCLPHVDTTGRQTDECALGLKTDVGAYYAVDFNQMPEAQAQLAMGDRFQANGTVTPIERLSTDHWQKYPIEGIFSVTDSLEKQ